MKLHLLLLLPSTASALTSIRRLVEQNVDILAVGDVDLSCTLSMVEDAESCESVSDATGNACVWCPVGADMGGCISQDMASLVNAAGIPHLHCGKQDDKDVLLEDETFFSELEACVTGGYNGDACLEDANCQYCVTKVDPTFGVCFSQDFVTEAESVVEMAKAFDNDMESWGEVFDCEGSGTSEVGSIADMSCLSNGNPDDMMFADAAPSCGETKDASDNDCVVANLFGFMDLCVSSTQKNVLDFILNQLDDMGIEDPMGMIMGVSSMSGEGGEALLESEDHFLLEPSDEEDEPIGNDFWYAAAEESGADGFLDPEFEVDYFNIATKEEAEPDTISFLDEEGPPMIEEAVPVNEYILHEGVPLGLKEDEEEAPVEVDDKEDEGDFDEEADVDEEEEEDDVNEKEMEEEAFDEEEDEADDALNWEGFTEEVPEIAVEFEDFFADSPEEVISPNKMIAGIMNKMEERKELEDESGK
jgi:hypothetical protein